MSKAFYFTDPEGNGVELYWDRDRTAWSWVHGSVEMATLYLDPNEFLQQNLTENAATDPVIGGARVGHVHLQVGDVQTAREFYVDRLGFEATAAFGDSALFVSAGGYHHHMAMNTWNSRGAGPRRLALGLSAGRDRGADRRRRGTLTERTAATTGVADARRRADGQLRRSLGQSHPRHPRSLVWLHAHPPADLLSLVPALTRPGSYDFEVDQSTVTATLDGDGEPILIADLDETTHTFRFSEQKSSTRPTAYRGPGRMPVFEAGGVYNAAKRGGLVGHKPSRRQVQVTLTELFTRNGWTRVR